MRENGSWILVIVATTWSAPRSNGLETESGATFRGNRLLLNEAAYSSSVESVGEIISSAAEVPSPAAFEPPNDQVAASASPEHPTLNLSPGNSLQTARSDRTVKLFRLNDTITIYGRITCSS